MTKLELAALFEQDRDETGTVPAHAMVRVLGLACSAVKDLEDVDACLKFADYLDIGSGDELRCESPFGKGLGARGFVETSMTFLVELVRSDPHETSSLRSFETPT